MTVIIIRIVTMTLAKTHDLTSSGLASEHYRGLPVHLPAGLGLAKRLLENGEGWGSAASHSKEIM